jgi:mannopine transport system permease protein
VRIPTSRIGWVVLTFTVAYLVLPTALVVLLSFGQDNVLRFPPRLGREDPFRWYREFLGTSAWTGAALRSVGTAALAAVIATLAGGAAAFALHRGDFPGKRAIDALTLGPLLVPPIVMAAGGFSLFAQLGLVGSYPGLAVMHAVLGVPYVTLIVSAALARSDPVLELASLSLGASPLQTFRRVTLPMLLPALFTGALFAFLTSFDEVVISFFLVSSVAPTLPVRIFASLNLAVSPVVAAVSTLQVILSVLLLVQLGLVQRWQSRRSSVQITRRQVELIR